MDAETLKAEGWTPREIGGFTGHLCPFWTRGEGKEVEIGFLSNESHSNNHIGTVHGGAMMTFADIALGYGVAAVLGHSRCVTTQLQLQFLGAPPLGSFVHCRPEVVRAGRRLLFVRGLIEADGRTVASADGIWTVIDAKSPGDQAKA